MVQHTLFVKNVDSQLQAELAKILGEQHKLVRVTFRNKPGTKQIKHALVVVETKADAATVIGLVDKKTINGKELSASAAKAPHEKGSYINRVARLKNLEKFPSVWPAPTFKNVANSDPLKNQSFPTALVHGEKLTIQPAKTIKKKVPVPSRALYLSKIPKTLRKKEIVEAFKNAKVQNTILSKNKKKLNYGFILFKNEEERKKAQESVKDQKITIGEHTIGVQEAKKFAKKTVVVANEQAVAKPAAADGEKKELSVNRIAKNRFRAYRINLHNRKERLTRIAAIKKLKERKQAIAQGKAQPRVVRKQKVKGAIVKQNPEVIKKAEKRAARKVKRAQAKINKAKKVHKKAAPVKASPTETTA